MRNWVMNVIGEKIHIHFATYISLEDLRVIKATYISRRIVRQYR